MAFESLMLYKLIGSGHECVGKGEADT